MIYASLSLLLDDRIRFLVGFISAAVVVAIILVILEFNLKAREKRKNRRLQQTPADRVKIYLASSKSVQDKLAFIDKTGKEYFKDTYGFPSTSSYSFLIKELGKKGNSLEIGFCKEMFSAFYSKKEISSSQIKDIGKMLVEIESNRTVTRDDLKDVNKDKIKIPFVDIKKKIVEKESKISVSSKTNEFLQKQELIGDDVKKMAAEDEAHVKREIEETKKSDERRRREFQKVEQEKKESQKRIEDRKKLVDERIAKRKERIEEKKRTAELNKRRREDEKQRRKEMYWRARAEKQEKDKQRDREREEMKRLEIERKKQKMKEQRELKEARIEKLKIERIGLDKNELSKGSASSGGVASRIVNLERQRLEEGPY